MFSFLLSILLSTLGYQFTIDQQHQIADLDSVSDTAQITFIFDHFYETYSQDLEEAVIQGEHALELSRNHQWKKSEGYASMYLGIATYLGGDYTRALKSFQRASHLFDSLDCNPGKARLYNEMAVFFRKQNDIQKMIACLDKAEIAAKAINDLNSLSTTYHHRGTIYSRNQEYEKAHEWFKKVLDIRLSIRDSVGLGYIYLDLAEYEANVGSLDKAFDYIHRSSIIRTQMGDNQGLAINEVSIGEIHFNHDQFEKAIPYFLHTIELAKSIGYTDLVRFAYDKLQLCYKSIGNFQQAYESIAQFQIYNDSIFNVEKSRAITEMTEKYESLKKEQQIQIQQAQLSQKDSQLRINRLLVLLMIVALTLLIAFGILYRRKLIVEREKLLEEEKAHTRSLEIKAALASQERERSRVAKDLHDGFGQMISILNLNLKSLEKVNIDRHRVFEQSAKVLEDMYQELKSICFNLMPQTLIKNGLKSAIREFAARINQTDQVFIETNFFGIDERLSELQEINLYRISQEWVNNILKYSDASHVMIQITRDEKEITLMIEDDGSGFDAELLKSGKGNGWRNMNARANLIKGVLELDTTEGMRGNALIVNVPVTQSTEDIVVTKNP